MNISKHSMLRPPNARFWEFVNDGWVKITLRPGQRLEHDRCGHDEEGGWRSGNAWLHCGTHVLNRWTEEGSDCDGRHGRYGTLECPIEHLRARPMNACFQSDRRDTLNGRRFRLPAWDKTQPDENYEEYAEAMNY